jgi:hypothetical protein
MLFRRYTTQRTSIHWFIHVLEASAVGTCEIIDPLQPPKKHKISFPSGLQRRGWDKDGLAKLKANVPILGSDTI